MTLQALRQRIGSDEFRVVLRRWAQEHAQSNADTGDLLALAERCVARPAVPDLAVRGRQAAGLPPLRRGGVGDAPPSGAGPLLRARLAAQQLSGEPAASVLDIVQRLLAVQAQDGRGARLAVRARSRGLAASDVDTELTERRGLVVSSLNRGTLHLVRAEDYGWLHALTAPTQVTANDRRLAQEGLTDVDADRGVAVVERSLACHGPQTRDVLREQVAGAGVRVEGQAFAHVLLRATLRGLVVRGPMVDGEHAFVLVRDWLGGPEPVDREVALGELARRYLVGHGPASAADLARWAGVTLGDARRGLRTSGSPLVELADGLVDVAGRGPVPAPPLPRLLGAFDPLLLGWTSRTDVVGDRPGVVTSNGVFRPFALVGGRAVALWSLRAGAVELAPFEDVRLGRNVEAALAVDAEDVRRFLAV